MKQCQCERGALYRAHSSAVSGGDNIGCVNIRGALAGGRERESEGEEKNKEGSKRERSDGGRMTRSELTEPRNFRSADSYHRKKEGMDHFSLALCP